MKHVRIRSNQHGLRAALHDLEADIMDVVWSKGWAEFSIADVHRELERRREIAYTTVMTTVHRLYEKELLSRRPDGKRHVYAARYSREAFHVELARRLAPNLPELSGDDAIALLVEKVSEADAEELTRLEELIRKRRRELGR